jgi:hypothetical protein
MPNGPEGGVIFGDLSVACTPSGLLVWPKAAPVTAITPAKKPQAIERGFIFPI